LRTDLVPARQRRDCHAGVVHPRDRDRQREEPAVDPGVAHQRAVAPVLLEAYTVATRQELDDFGADVVPRLGVLLAGVAEPDHQQVGRHGGPLLPAGALATAFAAGALCTRGAFALG